MGRTTKLRNIEAIQKMLAGEHRTQTRKTFSADLETQKPFVIRNVGDKWEEVDPHGNVFVVEQKNGYRVKKSKQAIAVESLIDSLSFNLCYDDCEKKESGDFGHGDFLMNKKTNRCIDCQARYEGSLKYSGKFNQYAKEKMRMNAEAFFADADKEVEVLLKSIEDIAYANEDGTLDKFEIQNPKEYAKFIRENYEKYKQDILGTFDEKTADNTI